MNAKEIEAKLRQYSADYYNGNPQVDDAEFDELEYKLRCLDPKNPFLAEVGSSVIKDKAIHQYTMGSQRKAMSMAEFGDWVKRVGAHNDFLLASYKMDGCSLDVHYVNGKLEQAITRGDGDVGQDVTKNARKFVRETLESDFTGYVHGEVILPVCAWELIDVDRQSNPRNVGTGLLLRESGDQTVLTFYAYNIYGPHTSRVTLTETASFELLEKLGFNVPPHWRIHVEAVRRLYNSVSVERKNLQYWIDGIVLRLDSFEREDALGWTNKRPNGQIALKFPPRPELTVLRKVEWSVGLTGSVVPTGIFDKVKIDGSNVDHALLCNTDEISRLDLSIGDTVELYKAGEIIPKVLRVVNRPSDRVEITPPTECPSCGHDLVRHLIDGGNSVNLYCDNPTCPAQLLNRLDRWSKTFDYLGLGKEILASLMLYRNVDTPADLYKLKRDELITLPMRNGVLGRARSDAILAQLGRRDATLPQFFAGLGIPGLGQARVIQVQTACPGKFDKFEDWYDYDKLRKYASSAGIPGYVEDLITGLDAVWKVASSLRDCMNIVERKTEAAENQLTFCITGTHDLPRKDIVSMIEGKGHKVVSSVSSTTSYLIISDPDSTSRKAASARKVGCKCIDLNGLKSIIGQ